MRPGWCRISSINSRMTNKGLFASSFILFLENGSCQIKRTGPCNCNSLKSWWTQVCLKDIVTPFACICWWIIFCPWGIGLYGREGAPNWSHSNCYSRWHRRPGASEYLIGTRVADRQIIGNLSTSRFFLWKNQSGAHSIASTARESRWGRDDSTICTVDAKDPWLEMLVEEFKVGTLGDSLEILTKEDVDILWISVGLPSAASKQTRKQLHGLIDLGFVLMPRHLLLPFKRCCPLGGEFNRGALLFVNP